MRDDFFRTSLSISWLWVVNILAKQYIKEKCVNLNVFNFVHTTGPFQFKQTISSDNLILVTVKYEGFGLLTLTMNKNRIRLRIYLNIYSLYTFDHNESKRR